jgi:hypothetical protein
VKRFLAIAATAAVGLVGCSKEQADTLEKAFENQIDSAQVGMRFDADLANGEDAQITVRGPYQRNGDGRLESFDWTIDAEAPDSRPFELRLISTGDKVFAVHKGTTYAAGPHIMRELGVAVKSREDEPQVEDIERLPGVDVKSWFPEADTEEDSEIAGEETTHVSGRLDVSAMLKDFVELTKHPAMRRQLGLGKGDRLSPGEVRMIDRLVSDPRFDVHVGKDDGKLRRIAGQMRFRAPGAKARASKGTLSFAVEYAKVDEPVTIEAPEGKARPIEDLLKRWGVHEG